MQYLQDEMEMYFLPVCPNLTPVLRGLSNVVLCYRSDSTFSLLFKKKKRRLRFARKLTMTYFQRLWYVASIPKTALEIWAKQTQSSTNSLLPYEARVHESAK